MPIGELLRRLQRQFTRHRVTLVHVNGTGGAADRALGESDGAIVALDWATAPTEDRTPLLLTAAQQLDAYFYCELRAFDLPLVVQKLAASRRCDAIVALGAVIRGATPLAFGPRFLGNPRAPCQ